MGTELMGRVTVEATVESLEDLYLVKLGRLSGDDVRRVVIPDALIDTGATALSLPTRVIEELGLAKIYEKSARSSQGTSIVNVYETVRLTVQGRWCHVDVVEVPNDVPTLVGQIPLEWMDWIVDPKNQRLIGNPDHGGEQMLELY